MRYESPELTVLTPAISAVQEIAGAKTGGVGETVYPANDVSSAYADWE